jgi:FtsH ternary system-associated peptide
MKVVSRFEANLLSILHFLLRRLPAEQALPLVVAGWKAPTCLGRPAVGLVQDALASGTPILLARAGGWRRERHLRGAAVVTGRLWERTPPGELSLSFTGESLGFLIWLTAVDLKRPKEFVWKPQPSKFTVGDRALFYFAYAALREQQIHRALGLPSRPAFVQDGLCRLAFPEDFGEVPSDEPPDFAPWTTGVGSCLLEALQPELAARWMQVERGKEDVPEYARMRALGQAQELVLEAYYKAIEAVGRLDLARFVLDTAAGVLPEGAQARNWVGGLETPAGARLADRAETYRAATAFLRSLERTAGWTVQARRTGYFDEGYAASQLWLAEWERCDGEARLARAREIIRNLDPLKSNEGQS